MTFIIPLLFLRSIKIAETVFEEPYVLTENILIREYLINLTEKRKNEKEKKGPVH